MGVIDSPLPTRLEPQASIDLKLGIMIDSDRRSLLVLKLALSLGVAKIVSKDLNLDLNVNRTVFFKLINESLLYSATRNQRCTIK